MVNKWYSVVNDILSMINSILCNPMVNGIFERGFTVTQSTITCSKLTTETLEQGVKYVQSSQ